MSLDKDELLATRKLNRVAKLDWTDINKLLGKTVYIKNQNIRKRIIGLRTDASSEYIKFEDSIDYQPFEDLELYF